MSQAWTHFSFIKKKKDWSTFRARESCWGKLESFQDIFQVMSQQWINRQKLVKIIDLYYYKGTKLKAMFLHLSWIT